MSGKSKFAASIENLLQWLPVDHVAEVIHSRDPLGHEVLTVEGMTVTILLKRDPLNRLYSSSNRQAILSSDAAGLGEFRVVFAMPPAIIEQEELLIRGYYAKHQRLSLAKVIEVG